MLKEVGVSIALCLGVVGHRVQPVIAMPPTSSLDPLEIHAPRYPEVARLARFEGVARVLVSVNPDGSVKSCVATKSLNPIFDRACEEAALAWRFSPTANPELRSSELTFEFRLWGPPGEHDRKEAPGATVVLPNFVKVQARLEMVEHSADPL